MKDLAVAYQEHDFPGKKLIATGAAAWGIYWVSTLAINWSMVPQTIQIATIVILLLASTAYLVGYWRAVKGKGYPPLLWLVSLTGFIGLLIILFLPTRYAEEKSSNKA